MGVKKVKKVKKIRIPEDNWDKMVSSQKKLEEEVELLKLAVTVLNSQNNIATEDSEEIGGDSGYINEKFEASRLDGNGNLHSNIVSITDKEYRELEAGQVAFVKTPYYREHEVDTAMEYREYKLKMVNILGKLLTPIINKYETKRGILSISGMGVAKSMVVIYDNDKLIGYTKCNSGGQWSFKENFFKDDYRLTLLSIDGNYIVSNETREVILGNPKRLKDKVPLIQMWRDLMENASFKMELQSTVN